MIIADAQLLFCKSPTHPFIGYSIKNNNKKDIVILETCQCDLHQMCMSRKQFHLRMSTSLMYYSSIATMIKRTFNDQPNALQ